jgi:thymidine kinase
MFVGAMFSSKTTRLMGAVDRYKYQNRNVIAFKPRVDNRYNESEITTHNGGKIDAIIVENAEDIYQHLAESDEIYDVVAVDEAFMIEGIADVLLWLFSKGVTVIVSSLDLSASCKPFDEIQEMMPWATHIEKCPAVCPVKECGQDAYYTYKKTPGGPELEVGGAEMYEPRCYQHYSLLNKRDAI